MSVDRASKWIPPCMVDYDNDLQLQLIFSLCVDVGLQLLTDFNFSPNHHMSSISMK